MFDCEFWYNEKYIKSSEKERAERFINYRSIEGFPHKDIVDEQDRAEILIIKTESFIRSICSTQEYDNYCRMYGVDESIW